MWPMPPWHAWGEEGLVTSWYRRGGVKVVDAPLACIGRRGTGGQLVSEGRGEGGRSPLDMHGAKGGWSSMPHWHAWGEGGLVASWFQRGGVKVVAPPLACMG
jgi:hypothetical protein